MSLLLDALKKAADDKQKVSQGEKTDAAAATEVDAASSPAPAITDTPPVTEIPGENEAIASQLTQEDAVVTSIASDTVEELTLDDIDSETEVSVAGKSKEEIPELALDDIQSESMGDIGRNERGVDLLELSAAENSAQDVTVQDINVLDSTADDTVDSTAGAADTEPASSYTISDDALSMLIYKTNADVRKNNRLLISGVLLMSLLVLVAGGFYYYLDMQAEIADLERKHQIAMQSMRSKTSGDKAPEKSEIIRNLVSDAGLDEKVEYAKKHMPSGKASSTTSSSPGSNSVSIAKKTPVAASRPIVQRCIQPERPLTARVEKTLRSGSRHLGTHQ